METKEKEMFEAAKELYEALHNDFKGEDRFEKWDVNWDDYEPENLEEWLEDKIDGDVFSIYYSGNQDYEFCFTWTVYGWCLGLNSNGYLYDEDIDEIKEIMDDIKGNIMFSENKF